MSKFKILIFFYFLSLIDISAKNPVKIKDLASIKGVRENRLMGIGLVTGLQGMGDSGSFKLTKKMVANLAINYGFDISEEDIKSKNTAAVLVTADIGGFLRSGDLINVTISSVGDAKSLSGGILLQTALKGADGNIYAVAQGRVIAGTKEQNGETTASIPNGGIAEREIASTFIDGDKISVSLKNPDFTTANLIREAIAGLNPNLAIRSIDAGLIEVILGEEEKKNPIDFISKLEVLTVTPDNISILIIDKKSGIIVSGSEVVIQ
ncbi:MAG TPA: flagellar basal body P-ring protein FlgI, partial [Spirochaetota bacterium]|nr:flagellar basal body P-ring protein FlgI [Spirochaetota bacterium]